MVVPLAVGVAFHGDGVDQAGGLAVGALVTALEVGLVVARGVLANGEGHLHREGTAATVGPGPGSGGEALAGTALDEGDRAVEGSVGRVDGGQGDALGVDSLLQDLDPAQAGAGGHLRGVGEVGGHRAGDQRGVGDRHRVAGGEGAVAVTDHVERGLGGLELGVGGQGAAGRGLLGLPVALGGHRGLVVDGLALTDGARGAGSLDAGQSGVGTGDVEHHRVGVLLARGQGDAGLDVGHPGLRRLGAVDGAT